METRIPADPVRYAMMDTAALRASFLIEGLFAPGRLALLYVETDRVVVGSAVPTGPALELGTSRELASDFFCQRRELGVLNLGASGTITVDGRVYAMGSRDGLYVGRGSREVRFASDDPSRPAQYYLVSYPAHAVHPTAHAPAASASRMHLGSAEGANDRTIHKYIHAEGIRSCQLVMGITTLAAGSVWNTMPCHTHARRSEIYLYFDLPADHVVLHLMGRPEETRHLVIRDRQAAISPGWSIHSACGTSAYSFAWAMGGENQEFTDMDPVPMGSLA